MANNLYTIIQTQNPNTLEFNIFKAKTLRIGTCTVDPNGLVEWSWIGNSTPIPSHPTQYRILQELKTFIQEQQLFPKDIKIRNKTGIRNR